MDYRLSAARSAFFPEQMCISDRGRREEPLEYARSSGAAHTASTRMEEVVAGADSVSYTHLGAVCPFPRFSVTLKFLVSGAAHCSAHICHVMVVAVSETHLYVYKRQS